VCRGEIDQLDDRVGVVLRLLLSEYQLAELIEADVASEAFEACEPDLELGWGVRDDEPGGHKTDRAIDRRANQARGQGTGGEVGVPGGQHQEACSQTTALLLHLP